MCIRLISLLRASYGFVFIPALVYANPLKTVSEEYKTPGEEVTEVSADLVVQGNQDDAASLEVYSEARDAQQRESIMRNSVVGVGGASSLHIYNASDVDDQFTPGILGVGEAPSETGLSLEGSSGLDGDQDALGHAAVRVIGRRYEGDPLNGSFSAYTAKDIFSVSNYETELLVIQANGNVGVGIPQPAERLSVAGAVQFQASAALYPLAGTIQWTGSEFLGFNGAEWLSLTPSHWLAGATAPGLTAHTGDMYLNHSSGELYQYAAGGWFLLGNLQGPAGVPGQDGQDGLDGEDGALWLTGLGSPAAELGRAHDLYLDTQSGEYYIKSASGWGVALGTLLGPQGPQGPAGADGEFVTEQNGDVSITGVRMGVGTQTPSEALHVTENIRVDGAIYITHPSGDIPSITY